MTFKRAISVALILVQVLSTRANPTALVLGPKEIMDSGQDGRIIPPDRPDNAPPSFYNIEESYDKYSSDDDDYFSDEDDYSSEDEEDYYDDQDYSEEDYPEEEYPDYTYKPSYEELVEYLKQMHGDENEKAPLTRVRRRARIVPLGGSKVFNKDRGGNRNPSSDRDREPWETQSGNKGDSISQTRTGPTGSDALFQLYPHIAPPKWRKANGYPTMQNKSSSSTSSSNSRKGYKYSERKVTKPQVRRKPVKYVNNSKSYSKRKAKLSKSMKEEVAAFANLHGVGKAGRHFTSKYRTPITTESVEKYLKRYQNRQERRGKRRA